MIKYVCDRCGKSSYEEFTRRENHGIVSGKDKIFHLCLSCSCEHRRFLREVLEKEEVAAEREHIKEILAKDPNTIICI